MTSYNSYCYISPSKFAILELNCEQTNFLSCGRVRSLNEQNVDWIYGRLGRLLILLIITVDILGIDCFPRIFDYFWYLHQASAIFLSDPKSTIQHMVSTNAFETSSVLITNNFETPITNLCLESFVCRIFNIVARSALKHAWRFN